MPNFCPISLGSMPSQFCLLATTILMVFSKTCHQLWQNLDAFLSLYIYYNPNLANSSSGWSSEECAKFCKEVRQESMYKVFRISCFAQVTSRNSLSKIWLLWTLFPQNMAKVFFSFPSFPENLCTGFFFVTCSVKFCPKKKTTEHHFCKIKKFK